MGAVKQRPDRADWPLGFLGQSRSFSVIISCANLGFYGKIARKRGERGKEADWPPLSCIVLLQLAVTWYTNLVVALTLLMLLGIKLYIRQSQT